MTKNIIVVFLMLAAFFIFWSGSRPLYERIKAVQKEKDGLSDFLREIQETRVLRDDLLANYNTISGGDLERLKKILPLSPEKETLIAQFENLATARNLNLKSVEIAESTKDAKIYKIVNVSLVLNGGYKDFLGFIKDLEENLRIVDFEEIAFGAGDKNIYEFSIKAKTYFLGK